MRIFLAVILAFAIAWSVGAHANCAAAEVLLPLPVSGKDAIIYKSAFKEAGSGRWSAAHRIAARAHDPLGARVLRWMDYSRSYNYVSFADISAFIAANPDWPRQRSLQASAETAMMSDVEDSTVSAWFRWRDPVGRDGRLRFADALINAGDVARAAGFVRLAWVKNNFSGKDLKIIYRRYKHLLRKEDHVARLDRLVWQNRQRDARRMLRYVDKGQQALAQARMALHSFAGGVDAAIARVPGELVETAGLMYERLRWRRRKGFDESARKIISALPEDLMKPAAWWHEIHIEIRRTIADGLITEAYEFANDHRQHQPLPVSEAEWLAGWIALSFLNDPDVAYPHFALLHSAVRYPISIARGAYWTGRAAAAVNNPVLARHWFGAAAQFPTTFYGQLALAALGGKELFKLPPPPTPNAGDVAAIDGYELTAVVRALAESGHKKLLRPFVTKLLDVAVTPGQRRLVAAVVAAAGRPEFAVVVARRSARKGTALIKYGYPVIDQPQGSGPGSMVDDALVLAMMRQESGFDQMAVSRAGALGYLQLMPATARTVAKRLGLPYSKARLTNDPDYNLTLGRAFIAKLLDNYDGSYALALAAYNAGPSRVRRWVRLYGDPRKGDIDIIDWIELIPISETRNYVQRVMEAVAIYRYRLGRPALVRGLLLDLQRGITVN